MMNSWSLCIVRTSTEQTAILISPPPSSTTGPIVFQYPHCGTTALDLYCDSTAFVSIVVYSTLVHDNNSALPTTTNLALELFQPPRFYHLGSNLTLDEQSSTQMERFQYTPFHGYCGPGPFLSATTVSNFVLGSRQSKISLRPRLRRFPGHALHIQPRDATSQLSLPSIWRTIPSTAIFPATDRLLLDVMVPEPKTSNSVVGRLYQFERHLFEQHLDKDTQSTVPQLASNRPMRRYREPTRPFLRHPETAVSRYCHSLLPLVSSEDPQQGRSVSSDFQEYAPIWPQGSHFDTIPHRRLARAPSQEHIISQEMDFHPSNKPGKSTNEMASTSRSSTLIPISQTDSRLRVMILSTTHFRHSTWHQFTQNSSSLLIGSCSTAGYHPAAISGSSAEGPARAKDDPLGLHSAIVNAKLVFNRQLPVSYGARSGAIGARGSYISASHGHFGCCPRAVQGPTRMRLLCAISALLSANAVFATAVDRRAPRAAGTSVGFGDYIVEFVDENESASSFYKSLESEGVEVNAGAEFRSRIFNGASFQVLNATAEGNDQTQLFRQLQGLDKVKSVWPVRSVQLKMPENKEPSPDAGDALLRRQHVPRDAANDTFSPHVMTQWN
ncbi:hypothetical protein NM208_g16520 [Fusarium decemcellulare]|uniref:Uncharacterized protein n=1 Tax=Fusarium decemcellulare TaxID=57161 RepID=A0ACC1RBU6_9HYPO|nr:hypothetical protein NM208_g16520 [Fusarium decemcellulare]